MNEVKTAGYAAWHKAVLIGCLLVALLGTVGVIGMMVKISATISEYGGSPNAAFFVAMVMVLMSVWLFAGSGALLVYIARTGRDIRARLDDLAAKA
jgi:hypothetical protein